MTTSLATHSLCDGQLDILTAIAEVDTPLGSLRFEDFRAACESDAASNGGLIHPSRVSAILHARFRDVKPNTFSAWWAPACGTGPKAFMDKTDMQAPIDPEFSKNNGNKDIRIRTLRKATS